MGDIGEYWKEHKEYLKEKRQKEGWVSNQYKTEKERSSSILQREILNDKEDSEVLRVLRKLKIRHELKNIHSFALEIKGDKYMLYTGKNGNRLHDLKTKEKWDLGQYYYRLEAYLLDFLKNQTR